MSLTTNDLKLIKEVMKITIEEELEAKLNEKLSYLPTKEEFYAKMDEVMGEIKAMREEHAMLSSRVYDNHEPRIKKVEKKLNLQPTI